MKGQALPIWEVYVDDPGEVPEAELRTEIYRRVGRPRALRTVVPGTSSRRG